MLAVASAAVTATALLASHIPTSSSTSKNCLARSAPPFRPSRSQRFPAFHRGGFHLSTERRAQLLGVQQVAVHGGDHLGDPTAQHLGREKDEVLPVTVPKTGSEDGSHAENDDGDGMDEVGHGRGRWCGVQQRDVGGDRDRRDRRNGSSGWRGRVKNGSRL